jgi:hypothetical protein
MKSPIKSKTLGILFASLLVPAVCAAWPASSEVNDPWIGVWQGTLDGQPSVTLTIANDTGAIGGTLVLDLIKRDGDHSSIAASEPHVLVAPQLDNGTLSFEVRRARSTTFCRFTVTLLPSGNAQIRCLDCGPNPAPAVEMKRLQ